MLDKELKFNRYENSFLWLKDAGVNNGAHFENAVAQQLIANGFEPYFCKKKNLGELDFVIEMSGKVVPIEVKSGKTYKSHKALKNFMNVPDYHMEKAYVFSIGNVETEGNVIYLPIYMCYLLKETSKAFKYCFQCLKAFFVSVFIFLFCYSFDTLQVLLRISDKRYDKNKFDLYN